MLIGADLPMCQGLTQEQEALFADYELECSKSLLWLQAVHADNKTTSKALGAICSAQGHSTDCN